MQGNQIIVHHVRQASSNRAPKYCQDNLKSRVANNRLNLDLLLILKSPCSVPIVGKRGSLLVVADGNDRLTIIIE